ncbi:alpha/beta-hydrolase [Dichomitus squalens LYAD-421 SS1]|uniref:Alpha/beta-hydrolase n=1 Tax=Dichomitus squalens (strain LYAD-421) TaxID=732165 RepID=R7SJR9_DICSQ|nr:alpha/beta-hydrolase [Dichomitus squalens LYAD-421 SS1]EJF55272.1 alpha/beta-hydrolase [Dichomitus squalens LYAD-421 SS1]
MSGTSDSEKPFQVAVSDEDIESLQRRLDLARLPDQLEGARWDYGVPLADIKRLIAHWKAGFDWRKVEAEINMLPMFTRDIEVEGFGTLNVHYVHQRSEVKSAIPLLFVHGWPGHFIEVRRILPLLTSVGDGHPSFHVVAPSLPGFGFSEAPRKTGFKGPQYAQLLNKLMLALGYNEYVYQGGDWGHILGTHAVKLHGHKHVKAWHTNMAFANPPTFTRFPFLYIRSLLTLPFDTAAKDRLAVLARFFNTESAYMTQHSTRPQTLGYSLADSPVGLLAWIYEKLVAWTDKYPWKEDEVLEWVSIYWFSRAGPAASVRIYYEMSDGGTKNITDDPGWVSVPVGVSYFPAEIVHVPKSWSQTLGKLVFESEHDAGGHFAAFEVPHRLAGDLRRMYGKGGPAHGVVPGKSGYDA